jgi:hypothetical protein
VLQTSGTEAPSAEIRSESNTNVFGSAVAQLDHRRVLRRSVETGQLRRLIRRVQLAKMNRDRRRGSEERARRGLSDHLPTGLLILLDRLAECGEPTNCMPFGARGREGQCSKPLRPSNGKGRGRRNRARPPSQTRGSPSHEGRPFGESSRPRPRALRSLGRGHAGGGAVRSGPSFGWRRGRRHPWSS